MEKQQVEPTKSKRPYKKRKLSVPNLLDENLSKSAGLCNDFGKEHRYDATKKTYRKRTGTAGLVQDAWKRVKDRWVNEERERTTKIMKYFSISIQEHEKEELAEFLAKENGLERSEEPDEEALAPDEEPSLIAKL